MAAEWGPAAEQAVQQDNALAQVGGCAGFVAHLFSDLVHLLPFTRLVIVFRISPHTSVSFSMEIKSILKPMPPFFKETAT